MSEIRKIKFHLVVFTVFLACFIVALLYLFNKNKLHFSVEVYQYSKNNIAVIDRLSSIGTNLYIHKRSLLRYINTQDIKFQGYLKDAKVEIERMMHRLEGFNTKTFDLWVEVVNKQGQFDYSTVDARKKLKDQIIEFQKGRADDTHFQRLFYLVRYNLILYFKQTQALMEQDQSEMGYNQYVIKLSDDLEEYLTLIYQGVNQLVTVYNDLFWEHTLSQNSRYHKNTTFYFQMLILASVILLLYVLIICVRVMRYFYLQKFKDQEENLILHQSKDMSTGLFNKESFEVLTQMELARARRRGYQVSILMIMMEELDWIKDALGQAGTKRIFVRLATLFIKHSRVYDRVYRYGENIFAVVMPEVHHTDIHTIIKRFNDKITKDSLFKKYGITQNLIKMTSACFPKDGSQLLELMSHVKNEFVKQKMDHTSGHSAEVTGSRQTTAKSKKDAMPSQSIIEDMTISSSSSPPE